MDAETIKQLIMEYGYFAVFFGTIWDASGVQVFNVAGGALASIEGGLNIFAVMFFGALGNFISDVLFYGIGRWRAAWLDRAVKSEKGRVRLELAEQLMNRYTWPLVAFGRFIPWLGRLIPAIAGIRRVGIGKSLNAMVCGSIVAACVYGLFGYLAGGLLEQLAMHGIWIIVGLMVLGAIIGVFVLKIFDKAVQRKLETRKAREQADQVSENSTASGR